MHFTHYSLLFSVCRIKVRNHVAVFSVMMLGSQFWSNRQAYIFPLIALTFQISYPPSLEARTVLNLEETYGSVKASFSFSNFIPRI
jgi:hypothetical protein